MKSTIARRRVALDADGDADPLAAVELDREAAVVQPRDGGAHAGRGVVLHVPHVALDGTNSEALR